MLTMIAVFCFVLLTLTVVLAPRLGIGSDRGLNRSVRGAPFR